jgi:hypothetical protein
MELNDCLVTKRAPESAAPRERESAAKRHSRARGLHVHLHSEDYTELL